MKYMQAEDAERNPSDCTSREIAVKVNNELQQTPPPPPLLLLLLFLLLPELLETCSQLSRESVNFPLPGFNPQAFPVRRFNLQLVRCRVNPLGKAEAGARPPPGRGARGGGGGGGRGAPGGRAPAASLRPACGKGSRAGVMKQDFCLPSSSLFFLSFSPPPPPPPFSLHTERDVVC